MYTIVRNTSGKTMYFSFLGERGMTLASGADAKVPGDLWMLWARNTTEFNAFKSALDNNRLEVLKTPAIIRYDATTTIYRDLSVVNGTVTAVDPDYGSYSGAATTVTS